MIVLLYSLFETIESLVLDYLKFYTRDSPYFPDAPTPVHDPAQSEPPVERESPVCVFDPLALGRQFRKCNRQHPIF